jgi:broad specificity phosphatase PhoE
MIFIRHAEKQYRNGESDDYPLDPDITEAGKSAARQKFRELYLKYGKPDCIVSSPFLRARSTAAIAQEVVYELSNTHVEIQCDNRIGEYLGNKVHINLESGVRSLTLMHEPFHPETYNQYSNRVRVFVASNPSNGWYISHGIVIQSVAFWKNISVPYPGVLQGVRFDGATVTPI